MKRLLYLLILVSLPFIFISCSDDDENPVNNNDSSLYFDAKSDDWWIYFNAGLDQSENELDVFYDTTKVVAIENFTDADGVTKSTAVFETKTSNDTDTETSYFAEDETSIWTTTDFILPNDLGGLELPINVIAGKWIKIVDKENDVWTVFEKITIEDVQIPNLGEQDISYEVLGRYVGKTSRNIMGSSMTTEQYEITTKITTTVLGNEISIDIISNVYFVEGVGLAEIYVPPVSLNLIIETIEFDGSRRILMDTNKK